MRRTLRWGVWAVLGVVGLAACDRPAYLELTPREHVFRRVGEDVWWQMKAMTREGRHLYRVTAAWSTSDPRVITIDARGRVKAVGPGRASVMARVGDVKAEAVVEVLVVDKVVVEPAEGMELEARGGPRPIHIKVLDVGGHEMTDRMPLARCSNEEVCRAASGEVYPVDPGAATLLVTCEGKKAEIPVKVTGKVRPVPVVRKTK
jgi:hypothetical protein